MVFGCLVYLLYYRLLVGALFISAEQNIHIHHKSLGSAKSLPSLVWRLKNLNFPTKKKFDFTFSSTFTPHHPH